MFSASANAFASLKISKLSSSASAYLRASSSFFVAFFLAISSNSTCLGSAEIKDLKVSMLSDVASNFLILSRSHKIEKTASLFAGVKIP